MPKKSTGATKRRPAAKTKTTTKTKKRTTTRKKAAAPKMEAAPQRPRGGPLRVKQVRSGIGHAETYRRTLRALGLKHHQDEAVVPDNASVRGMLHKVRHLVRVGREEA